MFAIAPVPVGYVPPEQYGLHPLYLERAFGLPYVEGINPRPSDVRIAQGDAVEATATTENFRHAARFATVQQIAGAARTGNPIEVLATSALGRNHEIPIYRNAEIRAAALAILSRRTAAGEVILVSPTGEITESADSPGAWVANPAHSPRDTANQEQSDESGVLLPQRRTDP